MRRLRRVGKPGDGAGLDGDEFEPAVICRVGAAEAEESLLEGNVLARVGRVATVPPRSPARSRPARRSPGRRCRRSRPGSVSNAGRAPGRGRGAAREPDREIRPRGLGGGRRLDVSVIVRLLERGRLAAADDDSNRIRAPTPARSVRLEAADEPVARLRVADRVEDRVEREQRVAGEVHLRDQPLADRPAVEREVDVVRPPGVRMVPPRYAPGLTVMNRYSPSSFVTHLPAPLKFGSSGASCVSTEWR